MLSSPSHPHKALTLLAVCLGTFMLITDVMIVVVALPSIRTTLHTGFSGEQWTIDAYSLSLAALLLPTGSLADILGRRRVFAAGLAAFTASSLLCGVAGSGLELIGFRALQGIGGATVFATSLALLAQTFRDRGLGMALGIWSAVVTLGLGCAPVLGGLLTELSWRWIFFVNVPVGVAAIACTLIGVPEFRPPHSRRIDLAGGGVFTLGLVALIYGLIESGSSGWGSDRVIIALAVAAAALAGFPLIERTRRQPMTDLSLLRKPTFTGGLAAAFGMNGSLYAILLYLVLYLRSGLHYSALGTGLRLIVITGSATATTIPAGRLSEHVPIRWLSGPGLGLIGLGLLLMCGLHAGTGWTHLILGFAIAGAGGGLVTPPLASAAVGVVQPQDAGMASGINSTFRQIGLATSVAALGSIFDSKIGGATAATVTGRYASALNEVLIIAACVAFVAGGLALVLIRRTDFHGVDRPGAAGRSPGGRRGDVSSGVPTSPASVSLSSAIAHGVTRCAQIVYPMPRVPWCGRTGNGTIITRPLHV
jgi:EmrB/QacA subfamily drug resistance transporter